MIGTVRQQGSVIEVYNENGNYLWSRNGELVGYTSNTVSIKSSGIIQVYDEKGNYKFSK